MTTTTNTCPNCSTIAYDTALEGMLEIVMDDHDVDYDVALAMILAQHTDLAEQTAEILADHADDHLCR